MCFLHFPDFFHSSPLPISAFTANFCLLNLCPGLDLGYRPHSTLKPPRPTHPTLPLGTTANHRKFKLTYRAQPLPQLSPPLNLTFKMASVAQKRLFHEYKNLSTNPPEGITAGPVSEDDMFYWEALIQGPEGTPFEGGVFAAELKFPKDYPLSPPTMKFVGGGVWHPNGKCESCAT